MCPRTGTAARVDSATRPPLSVATPRLVGATRPRPVIGGAREMRGCGRAAECNPRSNTCPRTGFAVRVDSATWSPRTQVTTRPGWHWTVDGTSQVPAGLWARHRMHPWRQHVPQDRNRGARRFRHSAAPFGRGAAPRWRCLAASGHWAARGFCGAVSVPPNATREPTCGPGPETRRASIPPLDRPTRPRRRALCGSRTHHQPPRTLKASQVHSAGTSSHRGGVRSRSLGAPPGDPGVPDDVPDVPDDVPDDVPERGSMFRRQPNAPPIPSDPQSQPGAFFPLCVDQYCVFRTNSPAGFSPDT